VNCAASWQKKEPSRWITSFRASAGGEDDLTNLQALCFKCNANKGARDDVDFRVIREGINARQLGCIFCEIPDEHVLTFNVLAVATRDKYPLTELHTLIAPKRHVATFFDLFEPERRAINHLLIELRAEIVKKDASVRRVQHWY
jgi:ATP adenylyltransferase